MAAIVGDSYVHFGTADVFVPFASDWKTTGVAWGIIGFYMLVAVQVSSWLMKKIPKQLWRSIHYLSYALFVTVSLHSITAGTDRSNTLFQALAVALVTLMVAATSIRILYAGKPKTRDVLSATRSSTAAKPSTPLPPPQP
jgi:DMSO/TMAO reductase YedYZ heme-binding membrane subunit